MKKIFCTIMCTALFAPSVALANSTSGAYSSHLNDVATQHAATATTPTTAAASAAGALPFTGLDVVLLVAGGLLLLGAGLVVRRISRESTGS